MYYPAFVLSGDAAEYHAVLLPPCMSRQGSSLLLHARCCHPATKEEILANLSCDKQDKYPLPRNAQLAQRGHDAAEQADLAGNLGPEGLDEGHVLGPLQEVHGHAVQQPRPARPGRQAHMQLVQMVAAAGRTGAPLYFPWLRQPCKRGKGLWISC